MRLSIDENLQCFQASPKKNFQLNFSYFQKLSEKKLKKFYSEAVKLPLSWENGVEEED
jgi:hypothetical protein